MAQLSDDMKGSVLMIAAMAAFTLNDACMKAVSETLPLFQSIVLRGTLTAVGLGLIAWRMGGLRLRFDRADSLAIALRCVGEVAGTFTFLTALRHMQLANLSAILQSLPLAVTLAAALVFGDRIGWRRLTAILVGFAGVLLIVRPGTEGFDRWAVLGLLSVAFVVLRDLSTRRLSRGVPSVSVAFYAAISVTLSAALAVPFEGWNPVAPAELALVAAAAACLVCGYLTVVMTMRVGDISVIAPFRYTALVFAIFLGWVAFGQLPDGLTLTGSAIVVATGLYTFHRERSRAAQARGAS